MKADMKATFFKAGKADAILIKNDGHAVMIDTGLEKNAGALLRKMKVQRLDALILTHYDKDHIGGARRILQKIKVGNAYATYPGKQRTEFEAISKMCQRNNALPCIVEGDVAFTLGDALYEIFAAKGSYHSFPSNNSSLIVRLTYHGTRFLFMGDAQYERIHEFIQENDVSCDILKIPYHGHMQDGLDQLAKLSKARIAVITNGENNPDLEEIEQTVSLFAGNGMQVHETRKGNVLVVLKEGMASVKH